MSLLPWQQSDFLIPSFANLALLTWTCQHIPFRTYCTRMLRQWKFKPACTARLLRTKDPALINLSFSDSKQHSITIFRVIMHASLWRSCVRDSYCKDKQGYSSVLGDSTRRGRWDPVTDLLFRQCLLAELNFLLVLLWYGHILLWPRSPHVSCLYHISLLTLQIYSQVGIIKPSCQNMDWLLRSTRLSLQYVWSGHETEHFGHSTKFWKTVSKGNFGNFLLQLVTGLLRHWWKTNCNLPSLITRGTQQLE